MSAITIEAWVKRDASRCETAVGNGWRESYWLGFCYGPIRFYHTGYQWVDGKTPIPPGQWTHIAVTYDGTTRRYYVNGQLDLETTANNGPITAAPGGAVLGIGGDRHGGYYFQGLIDEVRIWNVVRTQAEIRADMYRAINEPRPGLLAVWHFDGNAQDAVGQHHGILRGQASFSPEGFPAQGQAPTPTPTPSPTPTLPPPELLAKPNSGPPGSPFTLVGQGWRLQATPYVIFWDTVQGPFLGNFSPDANGTWSLEVQVPQGVGPGQYKIIACEGFGTAFERCASTPFQVTAPPSPTPTPTPVPPTPTPTPTPTATPTFTPTPTSTATPTSPPPTPTPTPTAAAPTPTATPTATPRPAVTRELATPSVLPPLLTPAPTPEGWCEDLGLGTEAVVVDFEGDTLESIRDTYELDLTGEIYTPLVDTHSPTHVLRSSVTEFFSGNPISVVFRRPMRAVGVFVGRDSATYVPGRVRARLSVFGVRADGSPYEAADTVVLPPGRAAVRYCLRVEAPAGVAIVRAQVAFEVEGGLETDPVLVDDLTFVRAGPGSPPIRNERPQIEILSPARGATIRDTYATINIRIREDLALRSVSAQVLRYDREGGYCYSIYRPTNRVEFIEVGTTDGWREYRASVRLNFPPYEGIYCVRIQAVDLYGKWAEKERRYVRPRPPSGDLDIEAVAMDVVQVVQCIGPDDNCPYGRVPLLQGKPTLVRLYLRVSSGDLGGYPVGGELCATGLGCVPSLNRVVPDADPDPIASDEGDLNATLNFMLPRSWIPDEGVGYSIILRATVNPYRSVEEVNYDNNVVVRNVRFSPPRGMKVNFIPVSVGGTTAPLSARTGVANRVTRVFPVSRVQIVGVYSTVPVSVSSLSDSSGGGCGEDWNNLMSLLASRREIDISNGLVSEDVHYLGMVPQGVDTGGVGGCGDTPGWIASAVIGILRAELQELAHNKGLEHAPGCGADNPDEDYPVPGGKLDAWGIDVRAMRLYDPASSIDLMGYCGGATWTSAYTYWNLYRNLPPVAYLWGEPVARNGGRNGLLRVNARILYQGEPQEYLVVGGVAYPVWIDVVTGPYRMRMRQPDDTPAGPYTVELVDGQGNVLYTRDFRATPLSNDDTPDVGTFFVTLPALEGTRAIRFLYRGEEITRLEASPGAPTVEILEPVGGEDWGSEGVRTIRWQASDPDGDPLRFTVQASQDGQRWLTLGLDLRNTNIFELDVAGLAGGSYYIRVLATDGFHTAEARTAAPITVARKSPTVAITSPSDGQEFPRGETVVFQGFATDLEDGQVPDEAYVWTSSLDGEIGRGATLWGVSLSPGEHVITLTVTDKDGMQASQAVRIRVIGEQAEEAPLPGAPQEQPGQPGPEAPPALPVVWLAVAAGLGLVLGLAFASLLWLRRQQ